MYRVVMGCAALFLSGFLYAGMLPLSEAEKATVNAQLAEVAKNTSSISSSFVQTKNLTVLSEKIRSNGVFYFKKDDKIRWEYVTPYRYIIIYNGSKVFINDAGKTNQFDARSNKIFKQINNTILASIKGVIAESPDFSLAYFKSANRYVVKLTPKSSEVLKYISLIEILVDNKQYSVTEVNIYEKSGDSTNIVFKNREFNKEIADSIFTPAN